MMSMAGVENPAKGFGKSIRDRKDTMNMSHDNIFGIGPILDGKMLDINMARLLSGGMVVDHIDSRHVIFIEQSRMELRISDFQKDSTKVFSVLVCCNSWKKLSLSTVSSSSGLRFRAI